MHLDLQAEDLVAALQEVVPVADQGVLAEVLPVVVLAALQDSVALPVVQVVDLVDPVVADQAESSAAIATAPTSQPSKGAK